MLTVGDVHAMPSPSWVSQVLAATAKQEGGAALARPRRACCVKVEAMPTSTRAHDQLPETRTSFLLPHADGEPMPDTPSAPAPPPPPQPQTQRRDARSTRDVVLATRTPGFGALMAEMMKKRVRSSKKWRDSESGPYGIFVKLHRGKTEKAAAAVCDTRACSAGTGAIAAGKKKKKVVRNDSTHASTFAGHVGRNRGDVDGGGGERGGERDGGGGERGDDLIESLIAGEK
eukprot:7378421-Prymnesium_polylepis.3